MAQIAGVGHVLLRSDRRAYEVKRVASHENIGKRLLDLGHVAFDTAASRATDRVMSMRFEGGSKRSIGRFGPVAVQAECVARLSKRRHIIGTMRIMAGK